MGRRKDSSAECCRSELWHLSVSLTGSLDCGKEFYGQARCFKLLRRVGVDWASDKDLPFVAQADVLGVRLDVSDTVGGVVRVANKPDRARNEAYSFIFWPDTVF